MLDLKKNDFYVNLFKDELLFATCINMKERKNLTAVGFEPTPVYTDQNTHRISKFSLYLSLAPWTARPYCLHTNL